MSNSSIWPIDWTLSGATTLDQSRPESNSNEGVLCFSQIPKTGASPLDGSMSYPGHSYGLVFLLIYILLPDLTGLHNVEDVRSRIKKCLYTKKDFMLVLLCEEDKASGKKIDCPVGWGCGIYQLHLCRGVRQPPPTSVLNMTLNNLMVSFQLCWSFGECSVPLHCHRSQVHSSPEWKHLIGSYLWVK